MKQNRKILSILVGVLLIACVSAGAVYYALVTFNVNIIQPISVNGQQIPATISLSDITCDVGETCTGSIIRIDNSGDKEKTIKISSESELSVSYVGKLELTKKDTLWQPVGDAVEISYTLVGDNFEYSGVPEGYVLVYYKDAVVGLEGRLDNPQPVGILSGNMPNLDDANLNADYSQAPDNYAHKTGAKLWAVPVGAIDGNNLDWSQMSNFYYETDLVRYFANAEGEIIVPADSFIELYPQVTSNNYQSGSIPVEITIA